MTPRGAQLLRYLSLHKRRFGVSPSYDEMRVAMGLRSKSGIHRIVRSLRSEGLVESCGRKVRSLRVLAPLGEAEAPWRVDECGSLDAAGVASIDDPASLQGASRPVLRLRAHWPALAGSAAGDLVVVDRSGLLAGPPIVSESGPLRCNGVAVRAAGILRLVDGMA